MRRVGDADFPRALATLLKNLGHRAVHVLDNELARIDRLAIWAYSAQEQLHYAKDLFANS
ncbi:MAG: DUF5615 family PIN-like protein [Verrucomicrobia bacterium]|nr:DUF5615 family PIN-like protein [Verrucomicrobiota bacterium]